MKFVLPLITALSLSACMSIDGGAEVSRNATGVNSCSNLSGISADYLYGNNVRCGPQTVLPYTVR